MDMNLLATLTPTAEINMADWVEQYRSFGPLISIAMAFLLSFIPPLPTLAVIGVNAAANGLWYGFIFS